jgi:peptidyl-prolyl cis-trans isomerase C
MVRARHILIGKKQAGSMEKAVKKAEELLKKINNGAGFEEIAKENSDCPSAEKGGDLGMFGRKQMVPEFDSLAFSLKVGEIGGPVETTFGAHLIRVDEKFEEKNISFKDAQPYIEKIIYQREAQKIMKTIANELRKTAKIEIF